ncbi:MAG: protein-PII uridylyltransferase [Novosphingobium lindaniclasticum]|jgi:[protein-PII] uridylyltransferase|uniref:Bifunctional uridylyltransferase/uridylyl-removing enzyme n=1 Tax=Novosphingobium lindaniclasticum LE124 TaxID=1096930 RepID=T0IZY7_9SPHN|nr:[protein-PII] uridylyltransferase [Novosphingobium lindaniclasticum]EQB17450.1 PII uridylyl-transferase [Novosphingobium lindaniclasticum LE124]MDF2637505.1 protein-PII uridylyltransferase [Novosphingobium lindaniclasticum]
MSVIRIPSPRSVIDRRALVEAIEAVVAETGAAKGRKQVVERLREALENGRAEIARRLVERPSAGHEVAEAQAYLVDQLLRVIHDHVATHVYPAMNRSKGERLSIIAVGGYGRGEMAPHSDVDLAFVTPIKQTAWCEQVIEAMLYFLWDLGLKIGHSSRSVDDMVRMSRSDLTIRTAMLEGRYVWGDQDLYEESRARFWKDVVAGTERQFVVEKLAEREERHKRMGDSRYVVEPNVKEGKGGLRDLHTLYWIGKYIHKVRDPSELVDVGLLTHKEYRAFRRAENFFWAVRCHLHTITRRAEDRLTFDIQREVAARMNYSDRPGKSAVERFMQMFFLQAKMVGTLTGVFLAQLDDQFAKRQPRGLLAGFRARPRTLKGYKVFGGRIMAPGETWFEADPVRLIEIFVIADREGLEIHPETMRLVSRDAALIREEVRRDPRANELFMELLTSRNNPEVALRSFNEAGVFGRFVTEFGRVNAQMQFDMYHHYTVDEHTIRAIGLISRIEKGELKQDHPLSHEIIHKVRSRRALYAAVLLHDIAKGRGGDHSEIGAEIALKLCPRFGLDEEETELVSWLVLHHLILSATAFKRDLSDAKTITDFVALVQSVDRLRQLTLLTIVDIRAVGPGTWNSWKRQLISELYAATEERLRLGHVEFGREKRVAAKKAIVADGASETAALVEELGTQFADAYWIAEPEDVIAKNLAQFHASQEEPLSIATEYYPARGATLVTVIASDHPGLFYRIAGGIHLAGGNIIDARIHTTRTGRAVDNFLVQDPLGRPFMEETQLARLRSSIENALANRIKILPQLVARPDARPRADAFDVRPRVLVDNKASNRLTVVEVNARDRPALLNRLAHALFESKLMVHSAHIATYGERAADTFYVTDLLGAKLTSSSRIKALERRLLEAASEGSLTEVAA